MNNIIFNISYIYENFLNTPLGTFFINMLFSVFIAFIIGLERELTGHKGSIKVNILIALGAYIFSSYEMLMGIEDNRISANIVTGVGFLCSGVIFKNGLSVNGLSTAATLWCSAGIGMITSKGLLLEAFIVSIFIFVLNLMLTKTKNIKPLKRFDDSKNDINYTYNIVCLKKSAKKVKKQILENLSEEKGLSLEELTIKTITEDKVRVVANIKVDVYNYETIEGIVEDVDDIEGVLSCGWTQADDSNEH